MFFNVSRKKKQVSFGRCQKSLASLTIVQKLATFFKAKNDFDFGNDEQICFDKYVELIRVIAVCNNFYKQPFVCF